MTPVYLESIGVMAPGLDGWESSRAVLSAESRYAPGPIPRYVPDMLPANERRRVSATIRLALQVACEAVGRAASRPEEMASVFVSVHGDLDISDRICRALTLPEKPVSPTDFHNTVHNAPAGYWSIGSTCRLPTTSLSAGSASFAAGLQEAVLQVTAGEHPVLLVGYDLPPPAGLTNGTTQETAFGTALVLSRLRSASTLGSLNIQRSGITPGETLFNKQLDPLLSANSSACSLLFSELVARGVKAQCALPYLDNDSLVVEYTPCR